MVELYRMTYLNSKFKQKPSYILMTFFKKLISDLPTKRLIFKPCQGTIVSQRVQEDLPLITIKDPFIPKFNWAHSYRDPAKLRELVSKLWIAFEMIAKGENLLQGLFLDEPGVLMEQDPSYGSGTGSGSKDKSLSSGSSEKVARERAVSDV